MVEIILLWIFCKRIAAVARARGRDPRDDCIALIVFWIAGELVGALVGALITGSLNILVYCFAWAGAIVGYKLAFNRAYRRPTLLNSEQLRRIRAICDALAEVDPHPYDRRVADLQREPDPERELERWERIAGAYHAFCEKHSAPIESKREVYRLLLLRSMMPPEKAIQQAQLRHLTPAEADEAMSELALGGPAAVPN